MVTAKDFVLSVDDKQIQIGRKVYTFKEFFNSPDFDLDFKKQVVTDLTLELRVRGFNGYDIYSYISEFWAGYKDVISR